MLVKCGGRGGGGEKGKGKERNAEKDSEKRKPVACGGRSEVAREGRF